MKRFFVAAAFLPLMLLGACSSGITPAERGELATPQFAAADKKAKAVTLSLSAEAQKQLPDNLKFNQDTLLATVRRSLEAKQLLVAGTTDPLPSIEIVVTSIRTRSSFSAVMFGFMAGDDHIKGNVIVRDAAGAELQRFGVQASYALGGLAGGSDEARMNWLYETFAKHTINELTGSKSS
jgi:hypothetical protein